MKTNQELKNAALAVLKGKWGEAVLATATLFLVTYAICALSSLPAIFADGTAKVLIQSAMTVALSFLVASALEYGYANAFRKLHVNGEKDLFGNMFRIGFANWGKFVLLVVIMGLLVSVGFMLLVVPGIYLALCYSMAGYLIVDRPELSAIGAMKESRVMMKGHKMDLFLLCLSFIGWMLLGLLTLGVGYLWLMPYMQQTVAVFYQDILDQNLLVQEEPIEEMSEPAEEMHAE